MFTFEENRRSFCGRIHTVKFYELAANQGNANARCNLGYCYQEGLGVSKDSKHAVELFELAANQGHPEAQNSLGFCYMKGFGVVKDEKYAVKCYERAAWQGSDSAQSNLGFCYQSGYGVIKDSKHGFELLELAGRQRNPAVLFNIGFSYINGLGVTQDLQRGIKFYELAAHAGFPEAQIQLGNHYLKGLGVVKDMKRAMEFFELAASQGNAYAQLKLGIFYDIGVGVIKDSKRAVLLYQAAALQGNEEAEKHLMRIIERWESYFPNLNIALEFYSNPVFIKNDPAFLKTLAFCYQIGLGTKQDRKKACELYSLAIDRGEFCQYDLFACYLSLYSKGLLDIAVLNEFYSDLEISIKAGNSRNAALLAYLYERGAPGLGQSLIKAFEYYQNSAKKGLFVDEPHVPVKIFYYKKMIDLRNTISTLPTYEPNIATIIAEYAFESSDAPESP